jgi:hypothetical protein
VGGDQRVRVECLLDRDAANKGRHLARDFVEPAKHHMLAGSIYARLLQYIPQARTREFRRAHCTLFPLSSRHLRTIETAAVSRALQGVDYRVRFQPREFGEADREWLFDVSANRDPPVRT